MNKKIFVICSVAITAITNLCCAQVTLNADGPGNTYELINSVFAPSGNVIESPDQTPDGSHSAFGRHIAEVFDADLNKYVFEFYSHLDSGATGILDNDISTLKTDRQRVEIKTYASSPNNLKGVIGETVTYTWRFKVPVGFQPSANFTHIHQVKPVDGDESSPIFTLTARKGSPNKMQLIYVVDANGNNDYKREVNLSLFEGVWVEATETIKVGTGTSGTYSITIRKVSDGTQLLSYSNSSIQTIRTAATDPGFPQVPNSFIRPKWGIYRSLLDVASLRDESIRFSDFSIKEGTLAITDLSSNLNDELLFANPVHNTLLLSQSTKDNCNELRIYNSNGGLLLSQKNMSLAIDLSSLSSGVYFVEFIQKDASRKVVKMLKK
nr:T9SS type A sorting domain-containing protein [uncultured Flavobacterium sp.]